jgi:tetratricopeptide (TPR) repeat protein/CHAT domain-containing protein
VLIARLHNVRGSAYQQLDQTSGAAADFGAARDIYSRQSDPTSRLSLAVNEMNLGALAEKDNRYADALALHNSALPEIEKAARAPSADRSIVQVYAGTLTDLGSLQGKLGKYELSEQNFRKAIGIYGTTTLQAGRVWSNLGDMLLSQGREKDADTALRTALAIRSRDPTDIGVAHTYTNIAELEARQWNLDASWQHAIRAFEIWNQAHDRDGEQSHILELSRAIHNLGILALDRGDSNSAIEYLRRAISLRPIDRSPEELMTTWIALADLAVAVRKPTDARAFLDKAQSIIDAQRWQSRPAYVILQFKRSQLLQILGDSLGALALQKKTIDDAKKLYGGSAKGALSESELAMLGELAEASSEQHDGTTATSFARMILQNRLAATGSTSFGTASAWHNLAYDVGSAALDMTGEVSTRGLEDALEMSGHAIDIYRKKGMAATITACADGGYDMGQDLSTAYFFHMILDYSVAQQRPEKYSLLVQDAFEVGQLAHTTEGGPALRGLIRRLSGDQTVAESVRSLNNLVRDRCRANQNVVFGSIDEARLSAVDSGIDEVLHKLEVDPRFRELLVVQPVALFKVISALKPGEALITFHVGADTLLMQSVTTQDGSVRVSGMSQPTLLAAIKGLRGSFAPESGAAGIARGFDGRASHSLYQEIIAPVIDPLIKGGVKIDHLILIPDGIMEGLPYNALLTEWDDSASNPARWKWLSNSFGLSVVPSVSALVNLPRMALPDAKDVRLVGFADPATESALGLKQLPGAADEIREAAAWFANVPGDLHFQGAASKSAFLSQDFHKVPLLVIAAHSMLPTELPKRITEPAIALAPGRDGDGFVTASEISTLDLTSVKLVVLSACNTGIDDPGRNGVLSRLAQAFLSAGAASVFGVAVACQR